MYQPPDLLDLFFADVEQTPIVASKREYVPLTRRIERGRMLLAIQSKSGGQTLARLATLIVSRHKRLVQLVSRDKVAEFVQRASTEIERFLDEPDWNTPPSVCWLVEEADIKDDAVSEEAWQYFYLISLIPPHMRDLKWSEKNADAFEKHFLAVRNDYEQSRHTLVQGTLRYPLRIATYYLDRGVPYLDLVQEGYLGLLRAIEKYTERYGANFHQYASQWIRQRILRYVADSARLIRVPVHRQEASAPIRDQIAVFEAQYGREPSDVELSSLMGWLSQEDIELIEQHFAGRRYKTALERLSDCQRIASLMRKPSDDIPAEDLHKVKSLKHYWSKYVEKHGEAPDMLATYGALGWLSWRDLEILRHPAPHRLDADDVHSALKRLRFARRELRYYRATHATHLSIERTRVSSAGSDRPVELGQYLIAEDDTETTGTEHALSTSIRANLSEILDDRSYRVLSLRYGLEDGEDRTLEEVGQIFGLTRERIRQIESKTVRRLKKSSLSVYADMIGSEPSLVERIGDRQRDALLRELRDLQVDSLELVAVTPEEVQRIEELIEERVVQARRRGRVAYGRGSKRQLCRAILEEHGQPMHYTAIHEKLTEMLPGDNDSQKELTYAALFASDAFQLLGGGVFGLAEWEHLSITKSGERTLHHCPQPLLPADADPRAFFESIVVGRDLLQNGPLTHSEFFSKMADWAEQPHVNGQQKQAAFNAWYAAGLIPFIDVADSSRSTLEATLPPDARLAEVREHCLNSLCRRVERMPELLLAIQRIPRPTVADLQKVLFGGEHAGWDVPDRLRILASFEAVQSAGNEWRLTPVGEAILAANPPQELPDFSAIDEAADEYDNGDLDELLWEEELGLLDI